MAKYDGKMDLPVITDPIIKIVDDAVGFLGSEFCDYQFRDINANPFHWKWVKIASHRRRGYTTAALRLLQKYTSSLIVTHNYPSANRIRQFAIENNLVPRMIDVFHDNIAIQDHIMPHSRMDDRWFTSLRPQQRFQLIILDPASMIEMDRQRGPAFHQFRDRLFNICDLVVELS